MFLITEKNNAIPVSRIAGIKPSGNGSTIYLTNQHSILQDRTVPELIASIEAQTPQHVNMLHERIDKLEQLVHAQHEALDITVAKLARSQDVVAKVAELLRENSVSIRSDYKVIEKSITTLLAGIMQTKRKMDEVLDE